MDINDFLNQYGAPPAPPETPASPPAEPQPEEAAQPEAPAEKPAWQSAPAEPQPEEPAAPEAPVEPSAFDAVARDAQPVREALREYPPAAPEKTASAGGKKGKKEKKEKTLKQQLTAFGIMMVVLCFVLSLAAGAGGAFAVMNYYPLIRAENTTGSIEITEGETYQIPETVPDASSDPSAAAPASETPSAAPAETTAQAPTEESTTLPPETTTAAAPVAAAKTKGEIYAAAVDSIVGIRASYTRQVASFFGMYSTQPVTSSGSGFFVTDDGYIVTNYHVIENAVEITVSTYDGSTYPATVRGYEESNDIAVLKVEGTFKAAVLGSSGSLSVGDDILVIGNPLGSLSYTFTDGVVSYLNRMITSETGATINMFQTNAAINEGNSGGPVYNMQGEVVGIASAKYASSSIEGLGFCIPINDVFGMISDIISSGYVTGKPVLGVSVQTVTSAMALRYHIPTGCYVVAVGVNTGADKAGILSADVITAIDGAVITDASGISAALRGKSPGDTVSVRVNREGTDYVFTVTLDEYYPGSARTEYSNVYDF